MAVGNNRVRCTVGLGAESTDLHMSEARPARPIDSRSLISHSRRATQCRGNARLFYFVQTANLVFRDDVSGQWRYLRVMSGGGRGQRLGAHALPYGKTTAGYSHPYQSAKSMSGPIEAGPSLPPE